MVRWIDLNLLFEGVFDCDRQEFMNDSAQLRWYRWELSKDNRIKWVKDALGILLVFSPEKNPPFNRLKSGLSTLH